MFNLMTMIESEEGITDEVVHPSLEDILERIRNGYHLEVYWTMPNRPKVRTERGWMLPASEPDIGLVFDGGKYKYHGLGPHNGETGYLEEVARRAGELVGMDSKVWRPFLAGMEMLDGFSSPARDLRLVPTPNPYDDELVGSCMVGDLITVRLDIYENDIHAPEHDKRWRLILAKGELVRVVEVGESCVTVQGLDRWEEGWMIGFGEVTEPKIKIG
jgi:hypothetical protein